MANGNDNDETTPMQSVGRFLFINKTSSTLSGDSEERFTISSHVSKTHRKWLKDEKLRKLQASEGKAVAQRNLLPSKLQIQPVGASGNAPPGRYEASRKFIGSNQTQGSSRTSGADASGSATAKTATWNGGYDPISDYSQPVYPFEEGQDNDYQEHGVQSKQASTHVRTSHWPSLSPFRGNSDPFAAAALPLGARDHEIIRQAKQFFVFVASPDKRSTVWRAPIADASSSHIRLRQTIGDEAEVHAILAAGHAVKAKVSKYDHTNSLARGLFHKTKAVELLRERLVQNGFSQSVTTLIRLLISLDFEASDNEAALVHLRGLWVMASTTPGILMDAQELLRVSDAWISISLLKKPEIDPTRYDPGERSLQPFDEKLKGLDDGHKISANKQVGDDTDEHPAFDSHAWKLLAAGQEIVNTKDIMDKIEDPKLLNNVVVWMNKRSSAVTGYCTTGYVEYTDKAALSDMPGAQSVAQMLMAAASLCAMMFMNFQFLNLPTNYDFSKTCQKIEEVLRSVSKRVKNGRQNAQDHDYLWLLFLTSMGNDIYSARGDITYSAWPVGEFHRICGRLELAEQPEIAAALYHYPHYGEMDVFLEELLWHRAPRTPIISWTRWRAILNHA